MWCGQQKPNVKECGSKRGLKTIGLFIGWPGSIGTVTDMKSHVTEVWAEGQVILESCAVSCLCFQGAILKRNLDLHM